MTPKSIRTILLTYALAVSWAAYAWSLPREAYDIADEIEALAPAVLEHPFEERAKLGKEAEVTLPQLRDRLTDMRERMRHERDEGTNEVLDGIATVQWAIKDLETNISGIGEVADEETFAAMREDMHHGLNEIALQMNDVVQGIRGRENGNFAH